MHSYAGSAGAIQGNECDINIFNCIFKNNTAKVNGGAIFIRDNSPEDGGRDTNRRGSRIHISNSSFSGNSALTGTGGVIYIFGEVLEIFYSTFSFNKAKGAGIMELMYVGEILLNGNIFEDNFSSLSGIINATDSTFVAINSVFDKNVVGRMAYGGCLVFTLGKASLENCTLSRNKNPGYLGSGRGGAITSDRCELRISACIFTDNEAGVGKDIFLNNDMLTYLTSFKHSVTYYSNDENFTDKVFKENIIFSKHPDDVNIIESQYASGKYSLQ